MTAVAVHVALLGLFAVVVFQIIPPEPEKVVDFLPVGSPGEGGGGGAGKASPMPRASAQQMERQLQRVMAAGLASELTLPDPVEGWDRLGALAALGGGGGGGFGSGRGGGSGAGFGPGSSPGSGLGGVQGTLVPGVTFFEQKIQADRVAYVIDFSRSMAQGGRQRLLVSELTKSISQLAPTMHFQLIFFSGPVWLAGDQVVANEERNPTSAVVTSGGKKFTWVHKGYGVWEPERRLPDIPWRQAYPQEVEMALRQIRETKLEWGTYWIAPLERALGMDPPPDVIYFMTDGVSQSSKEGDLRTLARRAKAKKTVINTIAMMEPEAEAKMRELAEATGGEFTIVEKGGVVRKSERQ